MKIVAALTWQRFHLPLPDRAEWRRMEKMIKVAEQTAKHPYAGMSVLDILWQDMDDVYEQLMERGEPDVDPKRQPTTAATRYREWGELRGQAQGLAFAIAVITNPYAVDIDAVKKQARERYENNGD